MVKQLLIHGCTWYLCTYLDIKRAYLKTLSKQTKISVKFTLSFKRNSITNHIENCDLHFGKLLLRGSPRVAIMMNLLIPYN